MNQKVNLFLAVLIPVVAGAITILATGSLVVASGVTLFFFPFIIKLAEDGHILNEPEESEGRGVECEK